jgi:type IV secretion system protein VirD4
MSIWETNNGVYFGFNEERKPVRYAGDRHLITMGPNGSGKSRRLLLPNLAELTGWSILVVDPKGELYAMTHEHRRKAGNEILVLDPFGEQSTGFNPISALDPKNDDFADDALWLAESIIRIEGKEPHWSQAAQELVAAIIMYVRLILDDKGSFADVRAMLGQDHNGIRRMVQGSSFTDPNQYELFLKDKTEYVKANPKYTPPFEYQDKLYSGMINTGIRHNWPEIGIKASRFGDITPENREILGVLSTALTQTRWLDSRRVKKDLAGPTFDFSVMKDKPVTVYLILPARRLRRIRPGCGL